MVLQPGSYRSASCVYDLRLRVFPQLQHDNNKDGYLTKDEVIQLSESLLVSSPSVACPWHLHS
jgi:hypothetical protein